jgi:hypothetical protein
MNLKDIDIDLIIKLANSQNENENHNIISITPNSNGSYFEDGKFFDSGILIDAIVFNAETKNGFNIKAFVRTQDYLSEIRNKKLNSIL